MKPGRVKSDRQQRGLPLWRGLSAAALALALTPSAHAASAGEYELKAAFIYNFAMFVDWPPQAAPGPLKLCVAGKPPFGAALDALEGRSPIKGRSIAVSHAPFADGGRSCDILYMGGAANKTSAFSIDDIRYLPILTIGESEEGARSGAAINLLLENQRLVFEINAQALKHSRLNVSSKLLRLAKKVHQP